MIKTSFSLWKYMFEKRYKQRTGISWQDGGGDDEEAERYFDQNFTPEEAVQHQMDKYDLDDLTTTWG